LQKGELFDMRYCESLAAINANPGISNAELAESYHLSYNIIRALTAAMYKDGNITGWVEPWGLYSKTRWYVNANKVCSQMAEMTSRTVAA
jgi:hypothetical protein